MNLISLKKIIKNLSYILLSLIFSNAYSVNFGDIDSLLPIYPESINRNDLQRTIQELEVQKFSILPIDFNALEHLKHLLNVKTTPETWRPTLSAYPRNLELEAVGIYLDLTPEEPYLTVELQKELIDLGIIFQTIINTFLTNSDNPVKFQSIHIQSGLEQSASIYNYSQNKKWHCDTPTQRVIIPITTPTTEYKIFGSPASILPFNALIFCGTSSIYPNEALIHRGPPLTEHRRTLLIFDFVPAAT
jgi:hypothetical protein